MADKIEATTIVGDTKIHTYVYSRPKDDEHGRRVDAVMVALELIKATCAGKGPGHLHSALLDLSKNADLIQGAVKPK